MQVVHALMNKPLGRGYYSSSIPQNLGWGFLYTRWALEKCLPEKDSMFMNLVKCLPGSSQEWLGSFDSNAQRAGMTRLGSQFW